jgi:hypothetical protein
VARETGSGETGSEEKRGQEKRGQEPKNKRIGFSKAIALPAKDQTTRLEPVIQSPAGSLDANNAQNGS